MSRSGYTDECDGWELIMWRGAVNSAIKGKRGQQFFKDLIVALDALPEKKLIAEDFVKDGAYCALGAVGAMRGVPIEAINPEDREGVAAAFDIAPALAAEVAFVNDEGFAYDAETPARRWERVRAWAQAMLKSTNRPA